MQSPMHITMNVSSPETYNEANFFIGFIEYEVNSLLHALQLIDYILVISNIRFHLERYLPNAILRSIGPNGFDMVSKTRIYVSL